MTRLPIGLFTGWLATGQRGTSSETIVTTLTGNPRYPQARVMNVIDKLRANASITPEGCWQWTRALNSRGYSQICLAGRVLLGHRVSYETFVGPIPVDMQIDHLCRNKACINPAHLEVVTAEENAQRRPDVHKTHCICGHALTAENTVIKTRPNGREIRNCRTCSNARQRVPDGELRRARNRRLLGASHGGAS